MRSTRVPWSMVWGLLCGAALTLGPVGGQWSRAFDPESNPQYYDHGPCGEAVNDAQAEAPVNPAADAPFGVADAEQPAPQPAEQSEDAAAHYGCCHDYPESQPGWYGRPGVPSSYPEAYYYKYGYRAYAEGGETSTDSNVAQPSTPEAQPVPTTTSTVGDSVGQLDESASLDQERDWEAELANTQAADNQTAASEENLEDSTETNTSDAATNPEEMNEANTPNVTDDSSSTPAQEPSEGDASNSDYGYHPEYGHYGRHYYYHGYYDVNQEESTPSAESAPAQPPTEPIASDAPETVSTEGQANDGYDHVCPVERSAETVDSNDTSANHAMSDEAPEANRGYSEAYPDEQYAYPAHDMGDDSTNDDSTNDNSTTDNSTTENNTTENNTTANNSAESTGNDEESTPSAESAPAQPAAEPAGSDASETPSTEDQANDHDSVCPVERSADAADSNDISANNATSHEDPEAYRGYSEAYPDSQYAYPTHDMSGDSTTDNSTTDNSTDTNNTSANNPVESTGNDEATYSEENYWTNTRWEGEPGEPVHASRPEENSDDASGDAMSTPAGDEPKNSSTDASTDTSSYQYGDTYDYYGYHVERGQMEQVGNPETQPAEDDHVNTPAGDESQSPTTDASDHTPNSQYSDQYDYYDCHGDHGQTEQADCPQTQPVENSQVDVPAEDASPRSGLELFSYRPGELLLPPDQQVLRTLESLAQQSSETRCEIVNDYVQELGSEAADFASRFENSTGIDCASLGDDLPGLAAWLASYRLVQQGELGMDEAVRVLQESIHARSPEWIDGVREITAGAIEDAGRTMPVNTESPTQDDTTSTDTPMVDAVAKMTARSITDFGLAVWSLTQQIAETDWQDLLPGWGTEHASAAAAGAGTIQR